VVFVTLVPVPLLIALVEMFVVAEFTTRIDPHIPVVVITIFVRTPVMIVVVIGVIDSVVMLCTSGACQHSGEQNE
jgi:hypothetical protein